jgi:hypothetical protein
MRLSKCFPQLFSFINGPIGILHSIVESRVDSIVYKNLYNFQDNSLKRESNTFFKKK